MTFEPDSVSSDQGMQDGTIKRSRPTERSNQAIKGDFFSIKIFDPVCKRFPR